MYKQLIFICISFLAVWNSYPIFKDRMCDGNTKPYKNSYGLDCPLGDDDCPVCVDGSIMYLSKCVNGLCNLCVEKIYPPI